MLEFKQFMLQEFSKISSKSILRPVILDCIHEKLDTKYKNQGQLDTSQPVATIVREYCEEIIGCTINDLGFDIFDVSPTKQDSGIDYSRHYHNLSDLNMPRSTRLPFKRHIIRMIDTDYQEDMRYWLYLNLPIIMYSFVPETLSGTEFEAHWHFKEGNKVEYFAAHNEIHTRELWDWNSPLVAIHYTWKTLVYDVDHIVVPNYHDIKNSHRIIVLTPRTRTRFRIARSLSGHLLRRFQPVRKDGTMRLDFVDSRGLKLSSIGFEHGGSMVIPTNILELIQQKAYISKGCLEVEEIQSLLKGVPECTDILKINCLLLFMYVGRSTSYGATIMTARKYCPKPPENQDPAGVSWPEEVEVENPFA